MGLFDSGGNQAKNAAERAAKQIQFRPPEVGLAGIGGVGFDTTGTGRKETLSGVNFNLDPQSQAIQGLFGGGISPAVGGAQGLVPQLAGVGGQALGQAGGALSALGSFDPLAAAESRFNRLDALLDERRGTDRSALESRLLAQGRLDSTAGARQLGEFEAGIERERANLLDRQFGEAQAAQANLANTARGLTGTGAGVGQGLFQQGLQGLAGQQQVLSPLFQAAQLSGDLGGLSTQAQIGRSNAIQGFNQQQAAGGGSPLSGLASGILGGIGTAFGGPIGGALGAGIGGLFGGGGGAPAGSGPLPGAQAFNQFGIGGIGSVLGPR